jgi:hypothetical protein
MNLCGRSMLLIACLLPAMSFAEEPVTHSLAGMVRDAADNPAAQVTLLVMDNATGIPIYSDGTLLTENLAGQRTDLLTGLSKEDGTFEIAAPAGEFRLMAQRWRPPTQPWDSGMGKFGGLTHFGPVVELFGTLPGIVVPSDDATSIKLAPMGTGTLVIDTNPKPGNDETLVVIGEHAPLLDPIFGFDAWRAPFLNHAYGMNRMPRGHTTFLNVPAGEVHLVAFANDNRAGFGRASATVEADMSTSITVDLVAGWSDGLKTPPNELRSLYDKAVANQWELSSLPSVKEIFEEINSGSSASMGEVLLRDDRKDAAVELPDGTSHSLMEVVTVWAYIKSFPPPKAKKGSTP